MRVRALAVTTALALAATGLTACTSKIGQAAVVGDHRISLKTVDSYVDPKGPNLAALRGSPIAVRPIVLTTLVKRTLFTLALRKTSGGVPSASTLKAKYYDTVAQQLTQGALKGGAEFDKELTGQIVNSGFRASFVPVFLETAELNIALISQAKVNSDAQYAAAIGKANVHVSINPRFGAWDASTATISTTSGAGIPSFVTIGPDTQTTATPVAGQ